MCHFCNYRQYGIALLFALFCVNNINAQSVGVGTTAPDPMAILDIVVPDTTGNPQGMILPRMWTTNRATMTPSLNASHAGMIVYDLNDSCVYTWKGNSWEGCGSSGGGGGTYWSTTGNDIAAGEYIGTNNAEDLFLYVDGSQIGHLYQNDGVAFGSGANATGFGALALGSAVNASGNRSVALGSQVSADDLGSFVLGDWSGSTPAATSSSTSDQFTARFQNGYRFFCDKDLTADQGVYFEAGGNVGIGRSNPTQKLDVADDVIFGGGTALHDGDAEFIQIEGQSDSWYIGVQNEGSAGNTDFFIGLASAEDNIFHIDNSGNVGIGLNVPSARLHVSDTGPLVARFDATNPMIQFYNTNVYSGYIQSFSDDMIFGTAIGSTGSVMLYTGSATRATLDSDGDFGIGISAPAVDLHVAGGFATAESGSAIADGATLTVGDRSFIGLEGNNATIRITDGLTAGHQLILVNYGPGSVTLDEASSTNIDVNGTVITFDANDSVTFIWSTALGKWMQTAYSDN